MKMQQLVVLSLFAAFVLASPVTASAGSIKAELNTIDTRPGVTQSFVSLTPENPVASVIVFSGGFGDVQIKGKANKPKIKAGKSFVVKAREKFAEQGLVVAVVDAPSDHKKKGTSGHKDKPGMGLDWRLSAEHMQDVQAVIKHLKQNNLPVFLAGQSLGTLSVVTAGMHMSDQINGIILSSSATKAKAPWKVKWPVYKDYPNAILDFPDLDKVTVPVMIVAHEKDSCVPCPPGNAKALQSAFVNSTSAELQVYTGGSGQKDGCNYSGYHSYNGIQDKVAEDISVFIKKHAANAMAGN